MLFNHFKTLNWKSLQNLMKTRTKPPLTPSQSIIRLPNHPKTYFKSIPLTKFTEHWIDSNALLDSFTIFNQFFNAFQWKFHFMYFCTYETLTYWFIWSHKTKIVFNGTFDIYWNRYLCMAFNDIQWYFFPYLNYELCGNVVLFMLTWILWYFFRKKLNWWRKRGNFRVWIWRFWRFPIDGSRFLPELFCFFQLVNFDGLPREHVSSFLMT